MSHPDKAMLSDAVKFQSAVQALVAVRGTRDLFGKLARAANRLPQSIAAALGQPGADTKRWQVPLTCCVRASAILSLMCDTHIDEATHDQLRELLSPVSAAVDPLARGQTPKSVLVRVPPVVVWPVPRNYTLH